MRTDHERHLHNHPWDAFTTILRGWYVEERADGLHRREAGDSFAISHDTFHRITEVSPGGVWTLFMTGKKVQTWGFDVDGQFMPHYEYL